MENKIKGQTTCVICGRDFPLIAEEHYVSREINQKGIATVISGTESKLWDSFDCPHCGCQNRVQQRNRLSDIFGQDLPLDDDEEDEDEDAPVCPFPKGGECYCKNTCDSECEFHPNHDPHPNREEKD